MNWYTRRLVESIFDNPDIIDIDDGEDIYDEISNDVFYKDMKEKIINIADQNMSENHIDVSYEIINSCLFFKYTYDYKGTKLESYLNQLYCVKPGCVAQIQELFDILHDLGIKYCGFYLLVNERDYKEKEKSPSSLQTLDFHGLTFLDINQLHNLRIQNFNLAKKPFLEDKDIFKMVPKIRRLNNNTITNDPDFYNCQFENCVIEEADKISLEGSYGLKDFSFLKQINESLTISIYSKYNMLPTNDFAGLPAGDYVLNICFRDHYNSLSSYRTGSPGFDGRIQTFYGVPNTLKELNISSDMEVLTVFNAITFEGIPLGIVNRTKIKLRVTGSRYHPVWVQYGCKKKTVSQMKWGPNKQELKDILLTKDFFLDCWTQKSGPHKEYVPPKESSAKLDLNLKDAARQNKAQEQKEKDAKDDMDLMIAKAKELLEEKHKYETFSKTRWFYVIEMNEDTIKVNYYSTIKGLGSGTFKWAAFIKKFIGGYGYLMDDQQSLYDLIYMPVKERRDKILIGRERQAKRQRKQDVKAYRQELKKEKQGITSSKEEETQELSFDQDAEEIINNQVKIKPDDIEVVDYSERAYAVFGNTYDLRNQLKEIGASYNKWLKYGNGKKPGWIIGKRKKEELEKIIGLFD